MKSLEEFKEELLDYFSQLGWEHWAKLGVSSRKRADGWINADPEALILLTGFLGGRDRRLVHNVIGWLLANQQLVHKSRLKKILKVDHDKTVANLGKIFHRTNGTANNSGWETMERYCWQQTGLKKEKEYRSSGAPQAGEYKTPKADRKNNRIVFRALFGTTVRAELFNFFFGGGSGSSRSIAEYIQSSQSTVYTILDELVKIGLVEKRGRSRNTYFELVQGNLTLEGLLPEVYFDWANYFKSIIKAWGRLETLSKPDSEYKIRSALRQFHRLFVDNLSDWNAQFVVGSVLRGVRSQDLMEKEEPAQDLLAFIKRLPKGTRDKISRRII